MIQYRCPKKIYSLFNQSVMAVFVLIYDLIINKYFLPKWHEQQYIILQDIKRPEYLLYSISWANPDVYLLYWSASLTGRNCPVCMGRNSWKKMKRHERWKWLYFRSPLLSLYSRNLSHHWTPKMYVVPIVMICFMLMTIVLGYEKTWAAFFTFQIHVTVIFLVTLCWHIIYL